jgi:hypothetical protein
MAILAIILMGFAAGAAVTNQYPVVGETITQQEQVCDNDVCGEK